MSERESRRSSRLSNNSTDAANIPIVNKTIQNVNAKGRSKTPKAKLHEATAQTLGARKPRSVSTKKAKPPKIECIIVKINGPDLNPDPLLSEICNQYAFYPIGKFNGNDELNVGTICHLEFDLRKYKGSVSCTIYKNQIVLVAKPGIFMDFQKHIDKDAISSESETSDMELNFSDSNTYNNIHDLQGINSTSLAAPKVKKTAAQTLTKSISELEIADQLKFQQNEQSELILNEIRLLNKNTNENGAALNKAMTVLLNNQMDTNNNFKLQIQQNNNFMEALTGSTRENSFRNAMQQSKSKNQLDKNFFNKPIFSNENNNNNNNSNKKPLKLFPNRPENSNSFNDPDIIVDSKTSPPLDKPCTSKQTEGYNTDDSFDLDVEEIFSTVNDPQYLETPISSQFQDKKKLASNASNAPIAKDTSLLKSNSKLHRPSLIPKNVLQRPSLTTACIIPTLLTTTLTTIKSKQKVGISSDNQNSSQMNSENSNITSNNLLSRNSGTGSTSERNRSIMFEDNSQFGLPLNTITSNGQQSIKADPSTISSNTGPSLTNTINVQQRQNVAAAPTSANRRVEEEDVGDVLFLSFEKKYWELFEAAIPKQLQMYSISVLKTRGYRDELNRIDDMLQSFLIENNSTRTLSELKDKAQSKRRSAKAKAQLLLQKMDQDTD